jgi:hypothetical protein
MTSLAKDPAFLMLDSEGFPEGDPDSKRCLTYLTAMAATYKNSTWHAAALNWTCPACGRRNLYSHAVGEEPKTCSDSKCKRPTHPKTNHQLVKASAVMLGTGMSSESTWRRECPHCWDWKRVEGKSGRKWAYEAICRFVVDEPVVFDLHMKLLHSSSAPHKFH